MSGDSLRFTLQPVFASPARQFRCHTTRRRPHVSYQLWFYVSVPSANFETPRVYVNVSQHRHVAEFLSVDSTTGLRSTAVDDVILTGRRDQGSTRWNYSVVAVTRQQRGGTDAWRLIDSHAISNNIRVLTAQPDGPFAFSTSSWVAQSTSCNVDVTHFRPVDKMSRSSSSGGQKVTADVSRNGGAFEYRLKSLNNPPHVKFLIPGTYALFLINNIYRTLYLILTVIMYAIKCRGYFIVVTFDVMQCMCYVNTFSSLRFIYKLEHCAL